MPISFCQTKRMQGTLVVIIKDENIQLDSVEADNAGSLI